SPERSAGLTTHVLDTSRGRPAAGLRIDFSRVDADGRPRLIRTVATNADGRVDAPLLGPGEMEAGRYELLFHVGAYFRSTGAALTNDAAQDRDVLDRSLGIVRRHHASLAQRRNTDQRAANAQPLARPRPLRVGGGAADQDVGAESPPVQPERRDGAVGGDQQREHVESLGPVETDQPDVWPDGPSKPLGERLRAPGLAVDERLAIRTEARVTPQQGRMTARGEDVAVVSRVDHAVARDSVGGQHRDAELLAAHRFHTIAPDPAHDHRCLVPSI